MAPPRDTTDDQQTITFFWNVSDYLQEANASDRLTQRASGAQDEDGLLALARDRDADESHAALWLLLLLRMTTVTTNHRSEVRNGTRHPRSIAC